MLDPISDMLTRIRNAQMVGKKDVSFSTSKVKTAVSKILVKEGFVDKVLAQKEGKFDVTKLILKYEKVGSKKKAKIEGIKRVSKQGQRIYVNKDEIKKVKNGLGIAIISTSQGVMTGKDARKAGLGGELICEVW